VGQQLTIPRAKDAPHTFSDEDRAQGQDSLRGLGEEERRQLLAWVGENLPYVRRTAKGLGDSFASSSATDELGEGGGADSGPFVLVL
jgi:hypothetical protein